VSAEEIIALETAVRDLARLYESAVLFTGLQQRAEEELLPRMSRLGALLRQHLRDTRLGPGQIQAAAAELHQLTDQWQAAIESIRADATYTSAASAFRSDAQDTLGPLLPRLFAGLTPTTPPAALYYPVPLAAPRRRPGAPPFLTPQAAAERAAAYRDGIEPIPVSDAWWDRELPFLSLGDDPASLDAPVLVALDVRALSLSVFTSDTELTLRVYTPRLRAPFSVYLANEPEDEWWEAMGSYAEFRQQLCVELAARAIAVLTDDE